MDNPQTLNQLRRLIAQRRLRPDFLKMCADHKASGKAYYETIFWASMLLNSGVAIMPKRNQINNIGVIEDSTHFSTLNTMPAPLRRIFTMKRIEQAFPLTHPQHVIDHVAFKERVYRRHAWGHSWIKTRYAFVELWLNLRHGHFKQIGKSVAKRLRMWINMEKHR